MLDTAARRLTTPLLAPAAARLAAAGVPATALTAAGWLAGLGACAAIVVEAWPLALVLWWTNRVLDGLDGAVARRRGATDLGGFLDVVADFSIYAGIVLAVAIAVPDARLAAVAVLTAYYVSAVAFLALSSILERRRAAEHTDERSLRFSGGIAEGTETVLLYSVLLLVPAWAEALLWIFTAAVAVTALQRVADAVRLLRPRP
ncbi:CDP-alcohol phosphatidyltransferase [Aeromicrobium marinum DSM 15272]|uniref:CDP-alcohol phosphatidyltransferase n=1 Tax=Aeromicrobium marinum DSM 15272 TaxID=585531 RepID=E2SEY3_9ACTN|nr:CDP-alcohol phosphatidyltransferase family protein [Aeromicrobium marinum]EFQ82227.1 CDP-alcohol phosphatidyltransferase [Aeromicrobium marinum DSM 15272]